MEVVAIQKLKSFSIFLILMVICVSGIYSQGETSELYLTLNGSISMALNENNQLKSSDYALSKAKWDKYRAWSLLFPTASVSSRYTWIDEQTFQERDFRQYLPPELADVIPQTVWQESYYTGLDVSMPLFNGALLNGLQIAGTNKKTAQKLNESTRNNVIFQVVSSYLSVLKTKELLHFQQGFTDLAKLNFEKAGRQQHAGRLSDNELLYWEIDYQTQQSSLINAEAFLRTSKSVLTNLINIDMYSDFEVETTVPNKLLKEADYFFNLPDESILEIVKLQDSELIKVNAALSASQYNTKLNKLLYKNTISSFLPNINLSYTYAWRENNTIELDDYNPETFMINMSIPLFTSFQNTSNMRSAYFTYKQSEEEHRNQINNTRLLLTETANKIIDLKAKRKISNLNVEYSQNNYRMIEVQYDRGLISDIDFINTKLALQNNELQDVNNRYDFISAIVELYYLLGKLDRLVSLD